MCWNTSTCTWFDTSSANDCWIYWETHNQWEHICDDFLEFVHSSSGLGFNINNYLHQSPFKDCTNGKQQQYQQQSTAIAITRVVQEVMSRIIHVDFAALDM
jgi:hypothetical protein